MLGESALDASVCCRSEGNREVCECVYAMVCCAQHVFFSVIMKCSFHYYEEIREHIRNGKNKTKNLRVTAIAIEYHMSRGDNSQTETVSVVWTTKHTRCPCWVSASGLCLRSSDCLACCWADALRRDSEDGLSAPIRRAATAAACNVPAPLSERIMYVQYTLLAMTHTTTHMHIHTQTHRGEREHTKNASHTHTHVRKRMQHSLTCAGQGLQALCVIVEVWCYHD